MENSIKTKLAALLLVVAASLSLQSCDAEFVFVEDIVDSWVLVESDGYVIEGYDADYYRFYSDHTGFYSYYDRFGRLWDEEFYWETRPGGEIYITFRDAGLGSMMCYYRVERDYLYFSDDPRFFHYDVYARSW